MSYSNSRALLAMVRASLQSIFKSPSAIFFGIGFPMIFILVFGFLGGGGGKMSIQVISTPGSDTNNVFYKALHQVPVLKWDTATSAVSEQKLLEEGDVVASIAVVQQPDSVKPRFKVVMKATTTETPKFQALMGILNGMAEKMNPEIEELRAAMIKPEVVMVNSRDYRYIDFLLPGQLGFSLLMGSIFGTAFVFFNMRQTLVLKRFFATPVRREVIVVSEGIARMLFQLLSAVVIIGFGHYCFDFTLVHGLATFLQLVVLSMIGILTFMAIGFIISGVVKNDASIPAFSNIVVLPQVFLAGTFFPVDSFPKWLQVVSKGLPLKYLNDAMRKVSFEGANLWDVRVDILVLLGFALLLYFIAARVFKWE